MTDAEIIERWQSNSEPWTRAVREGRIGSRLLATDAAIVDAVLARKPTTVLDIGCGEGWLARALATRGIDVLGVDAVADLVAQARRAGGGRFEVLSHEALADGVLDTRFDVCVCNFSLLGEASVERLLARMPDLLVAGGALIVQTLHPPTVDPAQPYRDGWREGSWCGIDVEFQAPAPWYFRTLESWVRLFADSGLRIESLREPLHPRTAMPLSLVLVGERA
ncbi:class I SAM-dependent methyltransferase [Dokdonella immobilis]|uniref:Methyltransferase domain-containing protein n=1 Tax=Dokdonella immobilis TaxID=578942 RepID=A0A1I4WWB8_9GAMM|nr:class I SAM-dependent methyltransferase [Dokdonella immobilis]SFN17765.1 Methyltransferase domain-containing protein [Dokdonella immobilis]